MSLTKIKKGIFLRELQFTNNKVSFTLTNFTMLFTEALKTTTYDMT